MCTAQVGGGSVGIAIDASEATALRAALVGWRRRIAHAEAACKGSRCSTARGGLASTTIPIVAVGLGRAAFRDGNPMTSCRSIGCRAGRKAPRAARTSGPGKQSCRAYRRVEPERYLVPPTAARSAVSPRPNPEGGVTYCSTTLPKAGDGRRFDGLSGSR